MIRLALQSPSFWLGLVIASSVWYLVAYLIGLIPV